MKELDLEWDDKVEDMFKGTGYVLCCSFIIGNYAFRQNLNEMILWQEKYSEGKQI
jgi:hypothetical protein